jgi:tRNA dimethylallyltransferase
MLLFSRMNNSKSHLPNSCLAILGPTASGKSDAAIAIARMHNGEIVSCDSRQIYRGMNIGSGKVPRDDQVGNDYLSQGIRHHLLDTVSPQTPYNVAKFQKKVNRAIVDIRKRKKLPILCGGTGFWAQAVIEQFDFLDGAPDAHLHKELETLSLSQLQKRLQTIHPQAFGRIDIANRVRVIRTLERLLSKTHPKTKRKTVANTHLPNPQDWSILVINPPSDILAKQIEKRLDERLSAEMIDEVYHLHTEQRVSWKRLDAFGLEYRWISRYLRGMVSFSFMRERILTESKQYAKRQRTWLRRWNRQGRDLWYTESPQEAIRIAKQLFSKNT